MFNRDGRLKVFDDFQVDRDLPKFKKDDPSYSGGNPMMMDSSVRSRRGGVIRVADWQGPFTEDFMKPTWLQSIVLRILALVSPKGKELVWRPLTGTNEYQNSSKPEITVQEFFSALKNGEEELSVVDGRARGYEAALARARKSGQQALVERLETGIEAVRAETQLHALNLTRTLTEQTLFEFVKRSPKGLRLDWVKNFTRVVPDDVLETKVKCDDRGIFDNYVVLHYDPEAKSWAETEAEIEARKDPILFGMIEGRRTLYFVGDWIDEFCDLTLDQIADVLYEGMTTRPSSAATELDPKKF